MSELEQLKAELENTQVAYLMAQEINHLKTGFLGRVAHEVRSPLSSLISLHQLILFDFCESPEEERKFLEHAYKSAQKLLTMIDEIILVSKLDYGTIPFNFESLDLNAVIFELQTLTKLQAANRNLKILFVPVVETVQIFADRNRLLQALVLLVDTAIQEIPRGNIQINIESDPIKNQGKISIEIPCSPEIWKKAPPDSIGTNVKNIEEWKILSEDIHNSPQMKFILAQTLFQRMKGELTIVAIPKPDSIEFITQLQGSLQLETLGEFDPI